MKIAVIGGGAAGLSVALMLARAGHEVLVFERARLEPAPDVETAAASAVRATAPQIVQPHIVMARCCELLRKRLPDVYDELLAVESGNGQTIYVTYSRATAPFRSEIRVVAVRLRSVEKSR